MIDPGVVAPVGSLADLGTLVVIAYYGHQMREDVANLAAGVVALARPRGDVDDERLQAELEVDDRDVASIIDDTEEIHA